jgi:hypothetical protein
MEKKTKKFMKKRKKAKIEIRITKDVFFGENKNNNNNQKNEKDFFKNNNEKKGEKIKAKKGGEF